MARPVGGLPAPRGLRRPHDVTRPADAPSVPPPAVEAARARLWAFGPYRLDSQERQLTRNGDPVGLPPKAFELLVALVERSGHLVRREELMAALWPDSFVEDGTLGRHVSALRHVLEGVGGPNFIETVPKVGYRFVGAAREMPSARAERSPSLTMAAPMVERSGRRWIGVAAVGLAALLLATLAWSWRSRSGSPDPPRSLAVLPFKPIGAPSQDHHLEIGLADTLIARLSTIKELEVRPISAVRRYVDPEQDPLAAARELGVDAVLDGTVQREAGRVRLTARLFRARDGASLGSGTFQVEGGDLFAAQDSIARQAVAVLLPAIASAGGPPPALDRLAAIGPEAYDAYLRGRALLERRTPGEVDKARAFFERAVAIDGTFAAAELGIATALGVLATDARGARTHAERALALDPTSADAHAVLGLIEMNHGSDWVAAERSFRAALALQPNHPAAHHWMGEMLACLGDFDRGLPLLVRAQRLDPISPILGSDLAKGYYFAGRYDEAIRVAERGIEMEPGFSPPHLWAGLSLLLRGRPGDLERAIADLRVFDNLDRSAVGRAALAYGLGVAGQHEEARALLAELEHQAAPPLALAFAHVGLGEDSAAVDELERMLESGRSLLGVSAGPAWEPLRDEPRFASLLRRANLDNAPAGP